MLNVGHKISELRKMTVGDLRREYSLVFGEQTRSFHKEFLLRRIAWRVQANAEGGLPERARLRAMAIATDADIRTRAPGPGRAPASPPAVPSGERVVLTRLAPSTDIRLPMPGALLSREYKGRTIRVRVLPKGFDYEGTVFRSLSAVAKAVTGAHWNGYLFFGIPKPSQETP